MFDFSGYIFSPQRARRFTEIFSPLLFFHHRGDGGAQSFFSVFLCVLSGCVFLPQSVRRGTEFFSQWLCFFTTEGMEGNRGFFYVNLLRKIKDLSRFIQ